MNTYALLDTHYVVPHVIHDTLLLGDHAEDNSPIPGISAVDVAVRSGDYLATLATRLDNISHHLSQANEPEHAELQKIIDELLSIDTKYQLSKRGA